MWAVVIRDFACMHLAGLQHMLSLCVYYDLCGARTLIEWETTWVLMVLLAWVQIIEIVEFT